MNSTQFTFVASGSPPQSFNFSNYVSPCHKLVGVNENSDQIAWYSLLFNFPNSFNPQNIPSMQKFTLKIYNVAGRKVRTLIDSRQAVEAHEIAFDPSRPSSGVYFYRMIVVSFYAVERMTVIK